MIEQKLLAYTNHCAGIRQIEQFTDIIGQYKTCIGASRCD